MIIYFVCSCMLFFAGLMYLHSRSYSTGKKKQKNPCDVDKKIEERRKIAVRNAKALYFERDMYQGSDIDDIFPSKEILLEVMLKPGKFISIRSESDRFSFFSYVFDSSIEDIKEQEKRKNERVEVFNENKNDEESNTSEHIRTSILHSELESLFVYYKGVVYIDKNTGDLKSR